MGPSLRWGDVVALLALLLLALVAAPASAQTFPQLTGRVVDQANLLSPEQELDLSSKSAALEAQSGRQFVVATVNSLEGRTIEDYGYRLGRHWGIGRKGEDDGVILLVAPNERKVRIETGYGARVFLTDALSSVIIRNDILPRFRQGDMAGGVMAGADAVMRQMTLPPEQAQRNIAQAEQRQAQQNQQAPSLLPVIFMMIIFFVIIRSFASRAGGRRYRGRGRRGRRGRGFDAGDAAIILWGLSSMGGGRRGGFGGGGGFGGFGGGGGFGGFSGGGGGFGGGGASGGW